MNAYIASYKNKPLIQVHAESSYQAQVKAADIFKAKKRYEVSVYLVKEGAIDILSVA